jgi:hypothetical protein
MEPERKSALLWGLVGALSFGVLYQGYVLTSATFDWRVLLGGSLLVGTTARFLVPPVERRLLARRAEG